GADRVLRHNQRAATLGGADRGHEQPVPERSRAAVGQQPWTAVRRGRRRLLHRSEQGRAAGTAVLDRSAARARARRPAVSRLYGRNMGWGGSSNTSININQLDPKYQTLVANTQQLVPNPFFGVAAAGQLSTRSTIEIGQLLRPFPQFGNVNMQQSTGAHSQYH